MVSETSERIVCFGQSKNSAGRIWPQETQNLPEWRPKRLAIKSPFPVLVENFTPANPRSQLRDDIQRRRIHHFTFPGKRCSDHCSPALPQTVNFPMSNDANTSDYTIHALKAGDDDTPADVLYNSLKGGEGRFGWSYVPTADLYHLKKRVTDGGWESLSSDEKECYQHFLLDFRAGDWVVYINMPEWGQCAAAKVTGPYYWKYEGGDYNHRYPVDPASVFVFDRNDAIVHPALSARLKLQGRHWNVYAKPEFAALITSFKAGLGGKPRTSQVNLGLLLKAIQPALADITDKIQRTHPNYDLEVLVAETLKNIPCVKEVRLQGGAGDHGADIIVTFEQGLPIAGLLQQKVCIVQVKSFVGEHADTQALEDIRRAFDSFPEATMGLIVSTARSASEHFDKQLEDLRETLEKPVVLLIGADVAAFFLRYGSQSSE